FLLESLPDVKAPFADARLLVAMLKPVAKPPVSKPAQVTQPVSKPAQAMRPASEPAQVKQSEATSSDTNFDWQGFLDKIKTENDVIFAQLKGAKWEISGSKLVICPEKSFAKVILKKPSNLRIICDIAGREVLIDEIKNPEDDILKTKISGIIGGEVQEYGGGNPFK
ncbi:MAG: hypothetical protein Q4B87_01900, partial [Candidatus Saccharibacteria bacterium]|nr:hypothetical protein [Candidatus Saccharibacteria bacterium]